jgi:hypothetical protein
MPKKLLLTSFDSSGDSVNPEASCQIIGIGIAYAEETNTWHLRKKYYCPEAENVHSSCIASV